MASGPVRQLQWEATRTTLCILHLGVHSRASEAEGARAGVSIRAAINVTEERNIEVGTSAYST
jgi:hypothetical protein